MARPSALFSIVVMTRECSLHSSSLGNARVNLVPLAPQLPQAVKKVVLGFRVSIESPPTPSSITPQSLDVLDLVHRYSWFVEYTLCSFEEIQEVIYSIAEQHFDLDLVGTPGFLLQPDHPRGPHPRLYL